jgi:hypothetical protein
VTGSLRCADDHIRRGEFFLIPALLRDRSAEPIEKATSLLRITIPM